MARLVRNITDLVAHQVEMVHGLSRSVNVASTIDRAAQVDLQRCLNRQDVFLIALHGPSKQGKTTILRNVFNTDNSLGVDLGFEPTRERIYTNLLTKANSRIPVTEVKRRGWKLALFGAPIEAGVEGGVDVGVEIPHGDVSDIDWVASTLQKATKIRYIVIDNFHHASEQVQQALARDFPTFGAAGFKVVIAGTWHHNEYLTTHNLDLSGYYRSISIDPWDLEELTKVTLTGAAALNFDLPRKTAAALASAAQGSIWALQTTTARFYCDQIAGVVEYSRASDDVTRVSLAAQRVSAEKIDELSRMLVRVSDWGAADSTNRSHVSYIVEAILRASPAQVRAGFTEQELKQAVDAAARAWALRYKAKATLMSTSEFKRKLRTDWMRHQIQAHTTPVIVYDRDVKLVTVNDSSLVFVHRTKAPSLLAAFQARLRERANR